MTSPAPLPSYLSLSETAPAPGFYARVRVGDSPGKGRGVFAVEDIRAGTLIEVAPVVIIPAAQVDALEATALYDYRYVWEADESARALALGYGSVYNHAYAPNLAFVLYLKHRSIGYFALRAIRAGTELCINYNGEPTDQDPVWFHRSRDVEKMI